MPEENKNRPIYICQECKGAGEVAGNECRTCGGLGAVLYLDGEIFYFAQKFSRLAIGGERYARK
ncbi:MAG TPA: hypothetical protein PLR18_02535, partial [bacterium]|nr:hypothetical protein [bacterium]